MTTIIILLVVVGLIISTYLIAKRWALTCPECGSRDIVKTGNIKDIERTRRALIAAPSPDYDYEYKCKKCNKTFWSTIEGIY